MVEDYGIPEDVVEDIKLKKPEPVSKEVKVIMDKNQALVRFPTIMTKMYGLSSQNKFKLTITKEKPLTLKLEMIK